MKRIYFLLFILFLGLISCKKDSVDATNTKTFQASVNDMASSLTTLQQVKFNEGLYILKTFGVEGENEIQKLSALGQLINGMKVPQILKLADDIAKKNGIDWTSTGPPSLGEMNIFSSEEPTEYDPNDIKAKSLKITTIETMKDSILGARAIQIIPTLVDDMGKAVEFSGAGLETVLEVFNSEGTRILTSKNLIQDSDFKGFNLRMSSLSEDKIPDGKIDLTVTVKTTNKDLKMTKIGIPVNSNFLKKTPQIEENLAKEAENTDENPSTETTTSSTDPKTTVVKFLNHLSSQNFRAAYEIADNPSWNSYDAFANPSSGFGSVKNIQVKHISKPTTTGNNANVNVTYDIVDKSGNTTALQVTFGLKNVNGEWKISNYKIKQ